VLASEVGIFTRYECMFTLSMDVDGLLIILHSFVAFCEILYI
jgi:hypothetical protein